MNSVYRVVFSKSRNALMVVNELTSCVQAKGTKTVVAVAAAAAMGSAMAADAVEDATPPVEEETPVVDTSLWTVKTVSAAETVKAGETIKINTAVIAEGGSLVVQGNVDRDPKEENGEKTSVLSVEKGGKVAVEATGNLQVNDLKIAGDVSATGAKEWIDEEHGRTTPAVGAYKSFEMTNGTLTLSQGGRVWIGSTWSKDPEAYGRMELNGGEVSLKDGGYITGNKRFVAAGEYYAAEDDGHDTVKIDKDTLAANVIGFDGAVATVEGEKNGPRLRRDERNRRRRRQGSDRQGRLLRREGRHHDGRRGRLLLRRRFAQARGSHGRRNQQRRALRYRLVRHDARKRLVR